MAELKAAAPGDILKFSTNGSQTVFASDIGQPQDNGGPDFLVFAVAQRCHNKLLMQAGEPRQHYGCVRAMRVVVAKF